MYVFVVVRKLKIWLFGEYNTNFGGRMKRIIGLIFVILGIALIGYGNYQMLEANNKNDDIEDKNDTNDTSDKNDAEEEARAFKEVETYLKNKYSKDFKVLEKTKVYCLEASEYNLFYSEPCTDLKVKNIIYKVKSQEDNIEFYVKNVTYDESKVTIPDSEKSNETKGYYDNYISYIVSKKVEEELLLKYKEILGDNIELKIYEGMGIYGERFTNFLQYLDDSFQKIVDTNISIKDFTDVSKDLSIGISIKTDEEITKENFKDAVDMFTKIESISIDSIHIDNIFVEYKNDNRYIKYDRDFGVLEFKSGTDIYNSSNDKSENVYEKSICLKKSTLADCISYEEFKNIDDSTFDF